MASTIKLKNGSGAPTAGDLVQGEPALDLTNKRLYTEDSGGTVIEVGTNPTSITTGAITATGVDVTGTATMDGLTVNTIAVAVSQDNGVLFGANAQYGMQLKQYTTSGGTPHASVVAPDDTNGWLSIEVGGDQNEAARFAANGDISFYEDTGTTPKFFWDASAESLGIGTNSPSSKLHLSGDGDSASKLTVQRTGATTGTASLGYNYVGSFSNNDFKLFANSAERMRIDASGNVGIGTSSPTAPLDVLGNNAVARFNSVDANGNYISFASNAVAKAYIGNGNQIISGGSANDWGLRAENNLLFASGGGTERMRIDSSGNLLVGTTDTSSSGAAGIKLKPDDGGANNPIVAISTAGYQSEVAFSLYSTAVAAWRFFVQSNGTISAVNTTITSLSDQRVKENVRDLDDGLAKVMQLQPRKFDWKKGKGKDISDDRGFIAQEFEQVFPDMISEWKDEAPEGEEAYKAINANLIPTLVKAIQEQQTLIESLTARIAALEE